MALELLSQLYTPENSMECIEISIDLDSVSEWLKGLFFV